GRTALYDALVAGLDYLSHGARARKALVVVSDGGDNASAVTLDRVLAKARDTNAAIYTIGLFAREIRSGYTIGYVPPDRDGNYHRVRVDVQAPSAQKVNIRTRPGYFAAGRTPSQPPP